MYYGCQDPDALNYLPTDQNGNPTVGCPIPGQGIGIYEGDLNNFCCCNYPPMLKCACCEGYVGGYVSMIPTYATQLPNGCSDWNGGNYWNWEDSTTFNPKDCYECTTFDFNNYTGQYVSEVQDAYNLGLQYGQAYGVLDGNSHFCLEICGGFNPSTPLSGQWPCRCCGDLHGCDDPNFGELPEGCWTCVDDQYCNQPGSNYSNSNPQLNYYNDQTSCLAAAPTNCPPEPSCANDPTFCSTNPYLTPGGPCWFCKANGNHCMPIYDYLDWGGGPLGSVATETFMMSWLQPIAGNPTTYQAQGSDLYCTEADCIAAGCDPWPWNCDPPVGGCPQGQTFVPYPTCQCQTPSKAEPKDDDRILPIDNDVISKDDEIEATKIQEGVKIKGKILNKLRMFKLANIKKK